MKLLKVRLNGERFWVKAIAKNADGGWRCRVDNNLVTLPYRVGSTIDVTPEMVMEETEVAR